MKGILQLVTRSDWAGAQKVLYTIVKGLKNEFHFEVACGPENGKLVEKLEELGITVHIVEDLVREISPLRDLRAFFQILSIMRKRRFDVVHTHSAKAGVLGGMAAKIAGVKLVIHTVHGWWSVERYRGLKRRFILAIERFASLFRDRIVLLCEREREKAMRWKVANPGKYVVVPNVVEIRKNVERGRLRSALGLNDNVKIIGNVARLDPPKNPFRFLKIAEEVLRRRNDVVFVWIGSAVVEKDLERSVEAYLEEKKDVFEDKVFFLPFVDDVASFLVDFDLMLVTSDSEGMPLAVLEALSLGVPVVSTDVGCLGEMEGVDAYEGENDMVKALIDSDFKADSGDAISVEIFLKRYGEIYRSS